MAFNPNNPNGQATAANSAPVVIASDQPAVSVKMSDGTNTPSVIVGDTGQNAQLVAGNRKEVAFSTTTVQAVATTDVSNYRWVSIHVTSQGTSGVINFQSSNDNVNWAATSLISPLANTANVTSTNGSNVIFQGPVTGRYFRLNVTGITAGTTAGVIEFFANPSAFPSLGVLQAGTWTMGVTGYPTAAATTDGLTNPTVTQIGVVNELFNGTAWDRWRNNFNQVALSSAARTATSATSDQTNFNWRGVQLVLSVTAASGTGGLQLQIQGKDSVSSAYYAMNNNPTAVIATGTYVYEIYPGANGTATGGVQQRTDGNVPRTWRINVVHGDASSYTYSVSVNGLV